MFKTERVLPVVLVFGAGLASLQGHAQGQDPAPTQPQLTLKSVSVDLPTGDRAFPGEANAEAINNNCLACHSAGMVLNQPALSRAAWEAEVRKMINVYKAPVAPEDVAAIVGYLESTKGIKPGEGTPQAR